MLEVSYIFHTFCWSHSDIQKEQPQADWMKLQMILLLSYLLSVVTIARKYGKQAKETIKFGPYEH